MVEFTCFDFNEEAENSNNIIIAIDPYRILGPSFPSDRRGVRQSSLELETLTLGLRGHETKDLPDTYPHDIAINDNTDSMIIPSETNRKHTGDRTDEVRGDI